MKKLGDFLQKFALDYVVKYLKGNKPEVIKAVNKKVNLPILNEKQEAELLGIVHEIIVDVAKDMKK